MEKNYRPKMLYPLGFSNGKPVPTPKGFGEGERDYYNKIPENRSMKPLKDFKQGFKKET